MSLMPRGIDTPSPLLHSRCWFLIAMSPHPLSKAGLDYSVFLLDFTKKGTSMPILTENLVRCASGYPGVRKEKRKQDFRQTISSRKGTILFGIDWRVGSIHTMPVCRPAVAVDFDLSVPIQSGERNTLQLRHSMLINLSKFVDRRFDFHVLQARNFLDAFLVKTFDTSQSRAILFVDTLYAQEA